MIRTTRRGVLAGALGALVVLATACYPPSQTPQPQAIPPGGRVVATSPALTELWIDAATPDLSTILYRRNDILSVGTPIPSRFFVYDDVARTTTEVPVGRAEYGFAAVSADGRKVVFSSNDTTIASGPIAANCEYRKILNGPIFQRVCDELYLFDLDTGVRTQLTGLNGTSLTDHASPQFTEDGTAVRFDAVGRIDDPDLVGPRRLDLATGQVEVAPPPTPPPTSWTRGTREIQWDALTGTLTATDTTTGTNTTLWSDPSAYFLASATSDGHYVVVSQWISNKQVFRMIDTDTGVQRSLKTSWISDDGHTQALVQLNVAPDGIDRLILAPI